MLFDGVIPGREGAADDLHIFIMLYYCRCAVDRVVSCQQFPQMQATVTGYTPHRSQSVVPRRVVFLWARLERALSEVIFLAITLPFNTVLL